MKKLFFICLIGSIPFMACNDDNNYKLIETTFKRTFDKDLIQSYLRSDNAGKVQTALLNVSHSEDTSFIPEIISLPFTQYGQMIVFAIGQIGPCQQSTSYLWSKIHSNEITENSEYLFEALGKTGTGQDLQKLVEWYSDFDSLRFPYQGISLAIRQFAFRGINSKEARQILIEEVKNPFNSINNKNEALFTLARTGSSDQINDELINILKLPQTENSDTVKLKQFALMNFRAQKYFPDNEALIQNVLNEKSTLLQIETARAMCYMEMKNYKNVDLFIKYLDSGNPNVSCAAANSVQFLKFDNKKTTEYAKGILTDKFNSRLTKNTKGELFLSYNSLFHSYPGSINQETMPDENIPSNYWYNYLGTQTEDINSLDKLLNSFKLETNVSNKISILTNLINFQNNFESSEELSELLINCLVSDFPPIVSIAAEGIDSLYITKNRNLIIEKINQTVSKQRDNQDFLEGIMSLVNLSERTDTELYTNTINELSKSKLYSVRKFIADKTGNNIAVEKPLGYLDDFIKNAFKYSTAVVETEKGSFKIEFLPQYAPVSVGNFCRLAKVNFYNGIEFHRVVPGFVIQCGDPTATGWGGPGYEIISEFSPLPYEVGMVGMASAGKDTEGSQWFVMQGNYPHLNGRYSVFAKVIHGMDVVYRIDQNDKIITIKLFP